MTSFPTHTRPQFLRAASSTLSILPFTTRPRVPRTDSEFSHELHPLIDEDRMADDKDLEQINTDGTSVRHAILDDPELQGLTLYERKALLVNRELDAHGMGKYQWYIFFLCGFGYLLDLLYAQAFGLVEPAIQQEFGFGDDKSGDLFSSFSAGLTAGAFVWGVLVDIIGRQYAFNLTVLIASIFGLALAGPDTYEGVLVLTAFVGFGVGGNIPIDTTICLEFLPQDRRFLLALLSVFQPIGVVLSSAIAYGLVPKYACGNGADGEPLPACSKVDQGQPCCTKKSNMGWRYMLIVIGCITLFVFFLRFVVFRFQESPKFLLYRGRDAKAVKVLDHVAKFNGRENHVDLSTFDALTSDDASQAGSDMVSSKLGGGKALAKATAGQRVKMELGRYKILFANFNMARLTILIWITYVFDYWGFSIAGSFLPKILLEKNKDLNISTSETYRNYILIYFPGVFGVLLGGSMYAVPRVGRKYAMVGSSALMGISLFLFATVNTQASNVGLNVMEYFFQSMFNAVLYAWTPEAFPAPIRGTACGVASFWGRLFSIVSPLIAADLLSKNINGPLYLAGAGTLVCTVAILLMPSKSMGAQSY